jgi:acyl transferase domain-containing protein
MTGREQTMRPRQTAVAIVAMAGRYPGGSTLDQFWQTLANGRDCISEIPPERWSLEDFYVEDAQRAAREGKSYCKWGGFVQAAHERTFIEMVGALLGTAGLAQQEIRTRFHCDVGVYLGARADGIGGTLPIDLANEIAASYGLRGPSVAFDANCASAAAALHFACEGLMRGDCSIAIAGGINILQRDSYVHLSRIGILAANPHGRSFGNGRGMLPAEAMGLLLLMPLQRAVAERAQILGVITATTLTNAGTRSPNPPVLRNAVLSTLTKAGIDAQAISYVEAAAMGGALVDSLEFLALAGAFAESGVRRSSCPIGAVKSNVGHARGCSGMPQITKVLLQMQHRQLAPSIKADPPNVDIDFAASPFYLQHELCDWNRQPKLALINCMGGGGAIVNFVIEEFKAQRPPPA